MESFYIYELQSGCLFMKEEIIERSLQLFLIYGVKTMTMSKLGLELGISTKAMYEYFENEDELLELCLTIHYEEIDDILLKILDDSSNVVFSIYRIYSKLIELDFGSGSIFYHDLNLYYPALQDKVIKQHANGILDTLTGLIEKGIEQEYFLSNLNAPAVLQTLTILYTSVTRNSTYEEFEMKGALILHTIVIYLRGISTDKGAQIINQLKELSNQI